MIDLMANIAKGGIHSCEKGRFIRPGPDEMYLQVDIGLMWPN